VEYISNYHIFVYICLQISRFLNITVACVSINFICSFLYEKDHFEYILKSELVFVPVYHRSFNRHLFALSKYIQEIYSFVFWRGDLEKSPGLWEK